MGCLLPPDADPNKPQRPRSNPNPHLAPLGRVRLATHESCTVMLDPMYRAALLILVRESDVVEGEALPAIMFDEKSVVSLILNLQEILNEMRTLPVPPIDDAPGMTFLR